MNSVVAMGVVLIATGISLPLVAQEEEAEHPQQVVIEEQVTFAAPDGSVQNVAPGSYEVDLLELVQLRLVPNDGSDSILISATRGGHQEDIDQTVALWLPDAESPARHLILMQPDGEMAEAVASPRGIQLGGRSYRLDRRAVQEKLSVKLAGSTALRTPTAIHAGAKAYSQPDLQAECEVTYDPDGSGVDVDVGMKNLGHGDAAFPEESVMWRRTNPGGTSVDEISPAGGLLLRSGESLSYHVALSTRADLPGGYSYTVIADPNGVVAERGEGNNMKVCSWTVTSNQPDFRITSVEVRPSSGPASTTLFEFDVTVRNDGDPTVGGVGVQCSLAPDSPKNVIGLASGASKQVTIGMSYYMPPGTKTVTCKADYLSSVSETNEGNNSSSATFVVTSG